MIAMEIDNNEHRHEGLGHEPEHARVTWQLALLTGKQDGMVPELAAQPTVAELDWLCSCASCQAD